MLALAAVAGDSGGLPGIGRLQAEIARPRGVQRAVALHGLEDQVLARVLTCQNVKVDTLANAVRGARLHQPEMVEGAEARQARISGQRWTAA